MQGMRVGVEDQVKMHQQAMMVVDGQQSIQHNAEIARRRFKLGANGY